MIDNVIVGCVLKDGPTGRLSGDNDQAVLGWEEANTDDSLSEIKEPDGADDDQ